jgi:hypothetical protein
MAATRYPIHLTVPILGFAFRGSMSPPLIAPQHSRSFVFEVLVKELSIRSIMIGGCDPFPWYDTWKSYAYASGAIDPARRGAASEPLAEIGGEVVAVLGEEVVRGSLKLK